jgi:two-component system, NtrC family, nitrogen regulation sensor histidine kinase NtrY
VNRLRNRLIAAFLLATVIPLLATLWLTTSLLERSLSFATTQELDDLSKSLESTAREFYQQAKEALRNDAASGVAAVQSYVAAERSAWPPVVRDFWESGEAERFNLSGVRGDHLDYLSRNGDDVRVFTKELGDVHMADISSQYTRVRELVEASRARDLRRGLTVTLLVVMSGIWIVSLVSLIYLANRISRPIQTLTGGLSKLASGNLDVRLPVSSDDETGRAIRAFNHMADQLQQNRDRLVYLTQVASWQLLARKMAHELKNSLTPIRLTVEEIHARQPAGDRQFMEQAVQIVVNEIETLERRVRAFSEFSSEPVTRAAPLDINALVEERIALLKPGHAEVRYNLQLAADRPQALADADQVKGIITNLLENAADAAGPSGEVLSITSMENGSVYVEIHDSGPGLSEEATRSLFEPTITFKKKGMGLGLSIARKNALLNGGDVAVIEGRLRGAAFRVTLPRWS